MNNLDYVRRFQKLRGEDANKVLMHSPTFKAEYDFAIFGEYNNSFEKGTKEHTDYLRIYSWCEVTA